MLVVDDESHLSCYHQISQAKVKAVALNLSAPLELLFLMVCALKVY